MREEIEALHPAPETGLTSQQVQLRAQTGWAAGEPVPTGKSEREIMLTHCFTFFNLIFLILAVLLVIARSHPGNMGFLGVVVVNTVIGIVQEIRAKRALEQLSLLARRPVKVIRDGRPQEAPSVIP